jgi:hypothetical protein
MDWNCSNDGHGEEQTPQKHAESPRRCGFERAESGLTAHTGGGTERGTHGGRRAAGFPRREARRHRLQPRRWDGRVSRGIRGVLMQTTLGAAARSSQHPVGSRWTDLCAACFTLGHVGRATNITHSAGCRILTAAPRQDLVLVPMVLVFVLVAIYPRPGALGGTQSPEDVVHAFWWGRPAIPGASSPQPPAKERSLQPAKGWRKGVNAFVLSTRISSILIRWIVKGLLGVCHEWAFLSHSSRC